MTSLPNPFIAPEDDRFVLDAEKFLADIERGDVPAFIGNPSPEYLEQLEAR